MNQPFDRTPLRYLLVLVLFFGATFARAVVVGLFRIDGQATLASYSNTPWALQKTGSFVPSTNPSVGNVNWTVTVTKGASTSSLTAYGYFEVYNNGMTPVPVQNVAIVLRTPDGGLVSADVADSVNGDAATQVPVDPAFTASGESVIPENAASDTLLLRDSSNGPLLLNSPQIVVAPGQTVRVYYTANFKGNVLALAPGTDLYVETLVSYVADSEFSTVEALAHTPVPSAIAANASVTLLDTTLTTSGTVTVGSFAGLNQLLTDAASNNVTVTADGGASGGSVCNTASLTSPNTTVATINNIPLVIPGMSLSAQDCDDIPGRPQPTPVTSCSQTVTYNASLFTTPNGPILSATFNHPSGSVFPFGTSSVTYSVTDGAGTWTGTFPVTVFDVEAPVIAPVDNMTVNIDAGKCTAKVTYATTATDCNPYTLTFSPASGSDFPIGTSTVTITATDTAGNTSSRTFTVTVVDNAAPVITAPNITVAAAADTCGANVTFNATATDCTGVSLVYSLNASFSPALGSGGNFPVGTTTVYVKATDSAGNASVKTFTVTVQDMQAPTITSPLSNLTIQPDSGQCYATFTYTPTATDNCGGSVTMTVSPSSGSQLAAGTTTTITVTATDSAGNVTTRTFTVTVGVCLGKLGNFVWYDLNANGTQDSGEPGVDGVKVTLYTSGGIQVGTTTTSGGGFYLFQNLTPGDYYVIFDQTTLPAGYGFTSQNTGSDSTDSDANPATGKSEGNATVPPGGYNDTVDAGIVSLTPGIMIVKDANTTIVGPNTPVTFTYSVYNTGGVPLGSITIVDDNATPDFPADDFNPTPIQVLFSGNPYNVGDLNHDNKLDVHEVWRYSATVIPPVEMTVTLNGTTYDSGMLSYVTLPNGDVRVFYRQVTGINDNTYGTGASPDWPSGHKFNDLVGSDKAGFDVKYSDSTPLVKFYMDYITASGTATATYSGYQSLGLSGDGSLVSGNASYLKDFDSTLELNLNRPGYTTMIVNSPVGDPNWDEVDGYAFTISAAAFTGGKSFGGAMIFDQHNSPSKLGVNSLIPSVKGGASVNTATVTGTDGTTVVTDSDDASVVVITGALGSIGDRVWLDANANGVQDAGEPGIPGVKVTLSGDLDKNGTPDYTATATTDANGLYLFPGLPPGVYTVAVDATTLPANVVQTYDLDGLATPHVAVGELASGQNRTDFDFGYVGSAPGFGLLKTASKTTAGFGEAITYTYQVFNNGSTPLTNIVLIDDNATPDDPSDDFAPTLVSGDSVNPGVLDPGELWTYTATVTPPIQLGATVNGQSLVAGTLTSHVLAGGDIRITYRQSTNVNDNTYGTGADAGWPSGHRFGDLTGSDKAGFELKDNNGQTVMKFYMDYISASATQDTFDNYTSYSGYRSLGATGGDGSMVLGSAANLYDFDSTLELNLNRAGYTTKIVDSPVGDPNWDVVDGYSFTVKAAAFGATGFGSVSIFDQHNSPSKLGVNSIIPTAIGGAVTNTAIVTAKFNGAPVVAVSDATVVVGQSGGPGGTAKFVVVDIGVDTAFKYSSAGAALGSFHLQAANKDARDIAANADGSKLWVLDKTKNVNVYTGSGTSSGAWKADGLGKEPEGLTLDGADLWAADRSRKIFWYKGAVNNAAGITDKPEKTLSPTMAGNLKGIVTDGTRLWVVTEGATDIVYRFLIVRDGTGAPTALTPDGSWKLATANSKPTGITLDPTGASQSIWIVDESTDTVYEYGNARSLTSGTGVVTTSFKLGSTNVAPQGLADPK